MLSTCDNNPGPEADPGLHHGGEGGLPLTDQCLRAGQSCYLAVYS